MTFLAAFALSLYGWGWMVARSCYGREAIYPAYRMALGITAVAFFGGVLNALGVATPGALDAILYGGMVLALASFALSLRRGVGFPDLATSLRSALTDSSRRADLLSDAIVLVLVAGLVVFLATVQMPAAAFNFHDDFQTYAVRPVRMLAVGTLGGNFFDSSGFDSLGGQTFLQAFFLRWLSVADLNGFDAVLCLALGLLLVREFGRHRGVSTVMVLLSVILFVAVDPQYVNVSSIYSGGLMILGLLFAAIRWAEIMAESGIGRWDIIRAVVPIALFATTLGTLKATYAVFLAAFLVLFLVGSLAVSADRRRVALAALAATLCAIVLAAPWLITYADQYAAILGSAGGDPGGGVSPALAFTEVLSQLLRPRELFWGGNTLNYTLLAATLVICFPVAAYQLYKTERVEGRLHAVIFFAASAAALASYLAGPFATDTNSAIRYAIPVFVGTVPVVLIYFATCVRAASGSTSANHASIAPARRATTIGLVVLQVAVIGAFAGPVVERADRAARHRTLLSFPAALGEAYKAYNTYALGEESRSWMRRAQELTDPDTTILASVSLPMHLDFKRNEVLSSTRLVSAAPGSGDRQSPRAALCGTMWPIVAYVSSFGSTTASRSKSRERS